MCCVTLQEHIVSCIAQFSPDEQPELTRNVLTTGGNTAWRGFANRLEVEVNATAAASDLALDGDISVRGSRFGGVDDAWIGGSAIGTLSLFRELCIYRADYDEVGVDIVHQKAL